MSKDIKQEKVEELANEHIEAILMVMVLQGQQLKDSSVPIKDQKDETDKLVKRGAKEVIKTVRLLS